MNLSPNEMRLMVICRDTTTLKRCIEAIDEIRVLENLAKTVQEADDLADAKELMFAKGNLIALKRNREYQLMEGQKAFVGDYHE
jgi:hypothetical protein